MPRKVKAQFVDGTMRDATEVDAESANEKWSEVTFEDGTVIRLKPVVVSATRFENEYDAEGNPFYGVKAQVVTAIVSVPSNLKKP